MIDTVDIGSQAHVNVRNTRNLETLRRFADCLKQPTRLENGDLLFKARIVYYASQKLFTDQLTVHIVNHGYDQGNVNLMNDGNVISADAFHMTLSNDFSKFSLGRSGDVLSIENRSSRLGEYRVDIEENIGAL